MGIETRDGEILTTKDDVAACAAEWSDTLNWRTRPTVSSVSLIFAMPAGTDPDKVLGAVRALALAELSDNHDYAMALHTDPPRPHVHLTVQAEGLDHTRFNPRPVQLNRFRERFARELRARGVAAEATPRWARGQGIAGSSMALAKLRVRLRTERSRQITTAGRRTNEQAIAVARGLERRVVYLIHPDCLRKLLGKEPGAGRAPFGRSQRYLSVTICSHSSLRVPRARPKSAPSGASDISHAAFATLPAFFARGTEW